MKKALLIAALISQTAQAAEWVAVPDTGADRYFYDNSKLVITDDEITYWQKVIYKLPLAVKGKEAAFGMMRERLHCGEHSVRLLSSLYYSADGAMLDYVSRDDPAAVPVIPDTAGDAVERVMCQLVWRKQEELRIKVEQAGAEADLKQQASALKPAAAPAESPPPAPQVPLPTPQQVMEQIY